MWSNPASVYWATAFRCFSGDGPQDTMSATASSVTLDAVADIVSCGPSPEKHLKAVAQYTDAGFDHIVLVQVGPHQDYFFDLFQRELAPALRNGHASRPAAKGS